MRPLFLNLTNDDREVRERLLDAAARPRPRVEALHDERLADIGLGDDERVDVEVMVVLGVGDRAFERLLDVPAMRLRENSRSASALSTFLPRIIAATRFSFCGLTYEWCGEPPCASLSLSLRGLSACPCYFLFAFLSAAVTVIGPGRRELAELVADHLFRDVHRNMLVAVVDAEGEADELRQDRGAAAPHLDDFVAAAFTTFSAFLSR
jgi:hypothetical protein